MITVCSFSDFQKVKYCCNTRQHNCLQYLWSWLIIIVFPERSNIPPGPLLNDLLDHSVFTQHHVMLHALPCDARALSFSSERICNRDNIESLLRKKKGCLDVHQNTFPYPQDPHDLSQELTTSLVITWQEGLSQKKIPLKLNCTNWITLEASKLFLLHIFSS